MDLIKSFLSSHKYVVIMILLLLIGSGSVVVGVISENPIQLIVGSLIFFGGTSIGFILMEDKK